MSSNGNADKEEASGSSTARGVQDLTDSGSRHKGEKDDESTVELIRKYLAEKLGFYEDDKETKSDGKRLEELSVDGVVKYIKEGKCKNIITLAGAGISTSAGIPDFRSPGSGLYDNLQKYNLPDPQAIFEIGYFRTNPKPFFTLAKELYPGNFKPTICHYFVRLLHSKGLLLRHYTQNIDTLERVAGLPGEKLVEAHGTFHTSHCLDCRKEFSIDWMKEQIFSDTVPTCTECNGIVKPDIIFFGESLPSNFFSSTTNDFPQCDLLIIMGSSLAVQPFASLVNRVSDTCPRLLLNREKVGERDKFMQLLGISSGLAFDSSSNFRDVLFLTDCDEGCLHLAEKLGWDDELKNLVKEEHKKIDEAVEKEKNLKKGETKKPEKTASDA